MNLEDCVRKLSCRGKALKDKTGKIREFFLKESTGSIVFPFFEAVEQYFIHYTLLVLILMGFGKTFLALAQTPPGGQLYGEHRQ